MNWQNGPHGLKERRQQAGEEERVIKRLPAREKKSSSHGFPAPKEGVYACDASWSLRKEAGLLPSRKLELFSAGSKWEVGGMKRQE